MLGYEEKVKRIELIDAVAMLRDWREAWTSCSNPWRTPTSWIPLTSRGSWP